MERGALGGRVPRAADAALAWRHLADHPGMAGGWRRGWNCDRVVCNPTRLFVGRTAEHLPSRACVGVTARPERRRILLRPVRHPGSCRRPATPLGLAARWCRALDAAVVLARPVARGYWCRDSDARGCRGATLL